MNRIRISNETHLQTDDVTNVHENTIRNQSHSPAIHPSEYAMNCTQKLEKWSHDAHRILFILEKEDCKIFLISWFLSICFCLCLSNHPHSPLDELSRIKRSSTRILNQLRMHRESKVSVRLARPIWTLHRDANINSDFEIGTKKRRKIEEFV